MSGSRTPVPPPRQQAFRADDLLRRDVIQALMCQSMVSFERVEAEHAITFDEYFAMELEELKPLVDDGLIEIASDAIVVTRRGRSLVRSVAMIFDRYLRDQRGSVRYSRII